VLVERGKLKGFLLGRSPVLPFKRSNGHGRRERGNQVTARQGNLIVTSRKTIPDQLRQALIDEASGRASRTGCGSATSRAGTRSPSAAGRRRSR
jgi:TldD protein